MFIKPKLKYSEFEQTGTKYRINLIKANNDQSRNRTMIKVKNV